MTVHSKAENQLYNVNSHGTDDLKEHWFLCISSKTARHVMYTDNKVKENYPTAVVSLSDETRWNNRPQVSMISNSKAKNYTHWGSSERKLPYLIQAY